MLQPRGRQASLCAFTAVLLIFPVVYSIIIFAAVLLPARAPPPAHAIGSSPAVAAPPPAVAAVAAGTPPAASTAATVATAGADVPWFEDFAGALPALRWHEGERDAADVGRRRRVWQTFSEIADGGDGGHRHFVARRVLLPASGGGPRAVAAGSWPYDDGAAFTNFYKPVYAQGFCHALGEYFGSKAKEKSAESAAKDWMMRSANKTCADAGSLDTLTPGLTAAAARAGVRFAPGNVAAARRDLRGAWGHQGHAPGARVGTFLAYARAVVVDKDGLASTAFERFVPEGGCFHHALAKTTRAWSPAADAGYRNRKGREGGRDGGGAAAVRAAVAALPRHKRVFVISQPWGRQYFHLWAECLPRLAPYLARLRADPGTVVHVAKANAFVARTLLAAAGLPRARLVAGPVFADEALIPEAGHCGQPGDHLWGVHALRRAALSADAVRARVARAGGAGPRAIVVVQRQSRGLKGVEGSLVAALRAAFAPPAGRYAIEVFADADKALLECVACTVALFARAAAIVAPHGAGLTNALFAPPGAAVLEIMSRRSLVTLCYPDLSNSLGHRHMVFFRPAGGAPDVGNVVTVLRAMLEQQDGRWPDEKGALRL